MVDKPGDPIQYLINVLKRDSVDGKNIANHIVPQPHYRSNVFLLPVDGAVLHAIV